MRVVHEERFRPLGIRLAGEQRVELPAVDGVFGWRFDIHQRKDYYTRIQVMEGFD